MTKRIAILGATGSIGRSAIDVVEHLGPPYRVVAISGHSQCEEIVALARRLRPARVAVTAECDRPGVEDRLHHLGCETLFGQTALAEIAGAGDVDVVLNAVVGAAGLPASVAAVEAGKTLLLANKESLVIAGGVLMPLAARTGATILPIDSEHSAVFQAMACGRRDEISRVILTASGGPFRTSTKQQMDAATPAQALRHPTWDMGARITVDSATMFNKAAEIVEAAWLFDLRPGQIEVVVHKESVVHSMVEFVDGSVIAQLCPPDMRTPIQFALTWPLRKPGCARALDFTTAQTLSFEPPDRGKFAALDVADEVVARRGTLGAVMNAANEVAVAAFLAGRVPLGVIYEVVRRTIAAHAMTAEPSLAELLAADAWARHAAAAVLEERLAASPARQ